jgi:hypothetical protein
MGVRGNAWYRAKLDELRRLRGNSCERCRGQGPFEFHHRRPTGLNGMGRGQNRRVLDILHHPRAYIMLCVPCHRKEHAKL